MRGDESRKGVKPKGRVRGKTIKVDPEGHSGEIDGRGGVEIMGDRLNQIRWEVFHMRQEKLKTEYKNPKPEILSEEM